MNPGIRPLPTQFAEMPNGLLGAATPMPMTHQSRYWHPEAIDWLERVVSNGGSVSGSTLAAVSDFCNAIDTAGIRSAMYRLNLFAGNGLLACLVPLYRAPSPSVRQIGPPADVNYNFVSSDYRESDGLKAGISKTLDCFVNTFAIPSFLNAHLSFSGTEMEPAAAGIYRTYLGSSGGSAGSAFYLQNNVTINRYAGIGIWSSPNFGFNATEAHMIGSRTSSTNITCYRSGVSIGTTTGTAQDLRNSVNIAVFNGSCICKAKMYSFGTGVTAPQAASFSAAVIAFNRALGR